MKRAPYILLLLYIAAQLMSCGGGNPVDSNEPRIYINNKTYVNEKAKFKLTAPANWTLMMDVLIENTSIQLIGTKNDYIDFQTNFNIIISEHAGTENMDTIMAIAEAIIKDTFENVTIISKKTVQIDDKTCGEMVYTFIYSAEEIVLQQKQLYIIHNNNDITITFTDLQSHYNQNKGYFEQIQNSIELM
ncbi:hypothetical protein JW935_15000 [candidate division KSB1 bacterium]|nr:hypothetical protein [candidate division KSB1 bacterium]